MIISAQAILDEYGLLKNIRPVAKKLEISQTVVRKTLITHGIIHGERTKEVQRHLLRGMTIGEIARLMKISEEAVVSHMPYTRGSYVLGGKTKNALEIKAWRDTKRQREET